MNVYRVTSYDNVESHVYVAANSMKEASASVSGDVRSVLFLGELTFAEGAAAITGGRALTEEEIKATITEDGQYLVSLENGKRYRSLKKHLTGAGLTPDQYRAKWGLPAVYPMVSVGYSIMRRDMALAAGLGRGKKGAGAKK